MAAAREAMVNAARLSGDDRGRGLRSRSSENRIAVFVRDRGPGFDPAAVPEDRRGVAESIIGRMQRHGGTATVTTAPGERHRGRAPASAAGRAPGNAAGAPVP